LSAIELERTETLDRHGAQRSPTPETIAAGPSTAAPFSAILADPEKASPNQILGLQKSGWQQIRG